ncbi:alpha beta hydrolase family [Fusarium denticulatum]|uniref:Alpha beta hydrolase family n=1 Tax=Fusarium denticulatum TaxID=48507 RepID=A0A8H5UBL4_9HYPO|nr:alpha beta hydrolase family [Fusarium denticulatum]
MGLELLTQADQDIKIGHGLTEMPMQPFKLNLSNGGTVVGLSSIPPPSATSAVHVPLIVALHGGTYDCHYFDASPRYSASSMSASLRIPFISIDRPSYGGTSSILPIPQDSDFNRETGIWLHRYILPKIWSEFGLGKCNCIVLLCHSLGVMGGVVAGALHAQDDKPLYPLGGLIACGMGHIQTPFTEGGNSHRAVGDHHAEFIVHAKDRVMFKPGTVPVEILEQSERLNTPSPLEETTTFSTTWLPLWKETWAVYVKAPVMFCLVEEDPFFVSTEEEVHNCVKAFKKSTRVDGSLMRGAPHCVELSYWSHGWYARCFGFAMECVATFSSSQ